MLIAVSVSLNCSIDRTAVDSSLEQLWVTLKLPNSQISIGVLYLPPDHKNDIACLNKHIQSIGAIFSNLRTLDHAFLFGDYNQSGLIWNATSSSYLTVNVMVSHISNACAALLDGFSLHGLKQINGVLNRNGRLLDLVLISDSLIGQCNLLEAIEPLTSADPDHPPLSVEFSAPTPPVFEQNSNEPEKNYHRADYDMLNEVFHQTEWTFLELSTNIDEAVREFCHTITAVLDEHVPERRPTPKPPWGNAHLRLLKRIRSRTLRSYSRNRCLFTKQEFACVSNNYRR